jgi:hypothetical protein
MVSRLFILSHFCCLDFFVCKSNQFTAFSHGFCFTMCLKNICIYIIIYSAGEYTAVPPMYPKVLRSMTNSGGPRPRALGDDHPTDAVPKARLSDVPRENWGSRANEESEGLSLRLV